MSDPEVKVVPNIKNEAEDEGAVDFGDADGNDNLDVSLDGITLWEDSGFKIKQIDEPQVERMSIKDLYELSLGSYLVLDTKYQRQVVWDENRSCALIGSLFQRYFIPPVVFNLKYVDEPDPENEGNMVRKCYRFVIDGKQRLTSIKKFMEGELGVLDNAVPQKKWFYCHPKVNGREVISGHLILPNTTKQFFLDRKLVVYEYSDLSTQIEETMFQVVQKGMPLTPAERMRALSTDWAIFAKQFENDYPKIVNLCIQRRASGFRCLIVIFGQIIEVSRQRASSPNEVPSLQASVQSNFKLLQNSQGLNEGIKTTFKEVFDRFQKVVDLCMRKSRNARMGFKIIRNSVFDPEASFLTDRGVRHVRSFSPLELLATAILILVHSKNRSDKELIDDIKELRVFLRKEYKDLRLNSQCWGTAWQYIDSEMKNRQAEDADGLDNVENGDLTEEAGTPARSEPGIPPQASNPQENSAGTPSNSVSSNRYIGLGSGMASGNQNGSASKKRKLDH